MKVHIWKKEGFENLKLPKRMKDGDAGLDLHSPCNISLPHGFKTVVDTGIIVKLEGFNKKAWSMAVPRSSVAASLNIALVNTLGVIDSNFCGPTDSIQACLKRNFYGFVESNVSKEDCSWAQNPEDDIHGNNIIKEGERFLQLVLMTDDMDYEIVYHDEVMKTGESRGRSGSSGK